MFTSEIFIIWWILFGLGEPQTAKNHKDKVKLLLKKYANLFLEKIYKM